MSRQLLGSYYQLVNFVPVNTLVNETKTPADAGGDKSD